MTKAVVRVGYTDLIMEAKDALAVLEALSTAEIYKEKWAKPENGGTTYHIYPQDASDISARYLRLLDADLYLMAKWAGKPET